MCTLRMKCVLAAMVLLFSITRQVVADPLPGEVAKFVQLPLNCGLPVYPGGAAFPGTAPPPWVLASIVGAPASFPGHDELSAASLTANGAAPTFVGQFQADDFSDKFNTPVVHVQW